MSKKQQVATFAGLFVALGLPFVISLLNLLFGTRRDLLTPLGAIVLIAEKWTVALILLGIVFLWEKQSLASIGIKWMSWRDVLWGIAGFIVGAFSFWSVEHNCHYSVCQAPKSTRLYVDAHLE